MKHKIIILGAFLLVGGIALLFWLGLPSGLNREKKVSTSDAIMADRSDKEKVAKHYNNNCSCELIKFLGVDSPTIEQKLTSGRFFKNIARDYYKENKKRLTEISVTFEGNLAIVYPQDFEGAQIGEVRQNGNGNIMLYRREGKRWRHITSFEDAITVGVSEYSISQMPIIAVYSSTWSEGGTCSIFEWSDDADKYQVIISGIYRDTILGEIYYTDCTMDKVE